MPDVLFVNGRFTTTDEKVIGVEDRGFLFGDGVYEVFKFLRRKPIFLGDHYRRMQRSLASIEIRSPWDESRFDAVMRDLLARTEFDDGIVYIEITRGEAPRTHFWPEDVEPTVIAFSRRFAFPDAARKELGIRLITTPDLRWKSCDVKSLNLLANAIAKKKAQRAGADEALLIGDGIAREGASSSFFVVSNGHIITHPLDEHILPGVVRDHAISLAIAAKIRVDERPLREDELFDLEEAFVTSTTQGVMPVAEIDGRIIGNSRRGEITTVVQRLMDEAEGREISV